MSVEKVLKTLKEKEVKYVDLRFTDTKGKWQHTAQTVNTIDESTFKDGIMFDGSSIAGWKNINESDIMELDTGHVALLKGEGWSGNEGNGLVHRSPHKNIKYDRLYMTIDFIEFYNKIFQNRLTTNH